MEAIDKKALPLVDRRFNRTARRAPAQFILNPGLFRASLAAGLVFTHSTFRQPFQVNRRAFAIPLSPAPVREAARRTKPLQRHQLRLARTTAAPAWTRWRALYVLVRNDRQRWCDTEGWDSSDHLPRSKMTKRLEKIGSVLYIAFWVSFIFIWVGVLMLIAERMVERMIQ